MIETCKEGKGKKQTCGSAVGTNFVVGIFKQRHDLWIESRAQFVLQCDDLDVRSVLSSESVKSEKRNLLHGSDGELLHNVFNVASKTIDPVKQFLSG